MILIPPLDRNVVRAGLDSLLGLPGGADDHVRFRRGLFECQVTALDRLAAAPDGPAQLQHALAALRDRWKADGRAWQPLERLADEGRRDPASLVAWVERAHANPTDPELARQARRSDVDVGVLAFYGVALAAPLVHARVRSAPPPVDEPATPGRCPCCGSTPGLALVTPPDGQRVLCCGTCAARWDEPRMACPGCGDTSSLVALRDPDRPRTWLEACTACHGALVTVDVRQGSTWGSHVLPLVERTASLYLDLLAEKEGYTPLHPYAALL